MRPTLLLLLALFVVSCSSTRSGARQAGSRGLDYVVTVPDPAREMFHVEGRLEGMPVDTLTIYFPIWTPGAYDLVYFGRYIKDVKARTADGRNLQVIRSDSNSARIVGATSGVTISYDVDDIEQLRGAPWFGISDIEPEYAFAVGAALFAYPEGGKDIPYTVRYDAPAGWDYTVALDPAAEANTFTARDYDELVDAPIQMGKFQRLEFTEGGKPHLITVTADRQLPDTTSRKLIERTRRVVRSMTEFFGEMPYERYVFQIYLADPTTPGGMRGGNFGALEHANSSTYLMPWFGEMDPTGSLVPVIAHEFWHLWSPKRIHVSELGPFDYQRAPNTSSLWFAEGLTEYYARLLLQRDDPARLRSFLAEMERDIERFHGKPQKGSIAELSRGIATVGFENIGELYSKGPILGLLLDATIRTQTGNRKSLDDALRHFNREYGQTGRTFGDDDIIPIMERVTGASLASFYSRYIDGREPLPIDELLPRIGLGYGDRTDTLLALGIGMESVPEGVRITSVTPRGSADSMGLQVGDILVRFTSTRGPFNMKDLPPEIYRQVVNRVSRNTKTITYLRDGVEKTIDARIIPTPVVERHLMPDPNATKEALDIRKAMLGV